MKQYYFLILTLFIVSCKPISKEKNTVEKPKMVIGIVVDQMRPDYLYRYADLFGDGGFNRLINQGYYFKNTHYNYIPTFTGPGHASIYTGTTPATHGIIANDWYDRGEESHVYCAGDPKASSVGTSSDKGEMSPHRLLSTTITDELLMSSNFSSKVLGISLKDRGAILPAGHKPNGCYWFDDLTGDFITSSYYSNSLPDWLNSFNEKDLTQKYLDSSWTLSFPAEKYTASTADNMPFEYRFDSNKEASFPYNLKELSKSSDFGLIKSTPFGNSLLTDLAIEVIEANEMGLDSIPDFLTLSYSSSDYIGHGFGPRSIELEDMYIKLDQQLARLLTYLDKQVGEGNYLLFLTADHAAAEVPQYMQELNFPAGYYSKRELKKYLDSVLVHKFGEGNWVENYSNEQVFFNHKTIKSKKLELQEVVNFSMEALMEFEGVAEAYSAFDMRTHEYTEGLKNRLQNGYNFKRSGDLMLVFQPGWFGSTSSATTHGSGYKYDTHVPLIWFGANIKNGKSYKPTSITDIAPTLSFILNTQIPNGAIGEPLEEVLTH